jgi:hypothetical protein
MVHLQEQQKNMTEHLGQLPRKFKYCKKYLGGAGTQTAGLAFGGNILQLLQEQQKNMMEQVGQQVQEV